MRYDFNVLEKRAKELIYLGPISDALKIAACKYRWARLPGRIRHGKLKGDAYLYAALAGYAENEQQDVRPGGDVPGSCRAPL